MHLFFDTEVLYATSRVCDGNMSFAHESEDLVVAQRRRFLETQGVHREECAALDVAHEDNICVIGKDERGRGMSERSTAFYADALMTNVPATFLFLMTADCFPVAYHDPIEKVIALAHLGWKPTEKKLAKKVVERMQTEFGSDPKNIKISIGPGIHPQSHVFDDPAQKNSSFWSPYLKKRETGEISIDLLSAVTDQLLVAGIQKENVQTSFVDTATSEEYFSHYRAVRNGEKEGRFVTVLGLK